MVKNEQGHRDAIASGTAEINLLRERNAAIDGQIQALILEKQQNDEKIGAIEESINTHVSNSFYSLYYTTNVSQRFQICFLFQD